jgi:peptide/nickel transport system permease protein
MASARISRQSTANAGATGVLIKGIRSIRQAGLVIPGTFVSLLMLLLASSWFIPLPPPTGGNILESNLPLLSEGHLLGTDMNGNDTASRLISGGRTSLIIAFTANALGLVWGGSIGASSALRGGVIDAFVMRLVDTFMAMPALMLILAIAQMIEPKPMNIALTLAIFSIPSFARLARTATLSVMAEPYMLAANLSGTKFFQKLARHVFPVIAPRLLTFAVLGLGTIMTIEGALSFLGFGIRLPDPSWGGMIYQGQQVLSASPRLVFLPCFLLFLTVLAFNILSQRLRALWERR